MHIVKNTWNTLIIILIIGAFFSTDLFSQGDTMYVQGRHIYSANGEKVVLRGINEMFVWSTDKTGQHTLSEIAKTGANCVRLVWDSKGKKEDLAQLIDNCIANKMVAMPECHDATGKWENLYKCVNFWKNDTIKAAIMKNKKWTLLNIGNEVGDKSVTNKQFAAEYKKAIDSIRLWGYTVPIVIDASNWGQDVDILFNNWKEIQNHDPLENVIFSVHSYWETTDNYKRIVETSIKEKMPIIIGEGPSITRYPTCELLDFKTGLTLTGENEIGWLSWSWGLVNNADCGANFDHTTDAKFGNWETELSEQLIVSHPYSLMQTTKRPASFYSNQKVLVSGVVLIAPDSLVTVGDSIPLNVILAPINATDTTYQISIVQGKEYAKLNHTHKFLKGISKGIVYIELKHRETGLNSKLKINVIK